MSAVSGVGAVPLVLPGHTLRDQVAGKVRFELGPLGDGAVPLTTGQLPWLLRYLQRTNGYVSMLRSWLTCMYVCLYAHKKIAGLCVCVWLSSMDQDACIYIYIYIYVLFIQPSTNNHAMYAHTDTHSSIRVCSRLHFRTIQMLSVPKMKSATYCYQTFNLLWPWTH